jgi:hypothetical protein
VCLPPASGIVAWYPGDGDALDVLSQGDDGEKEDSEGGSNGTLQNGATFAAGKVASGFSLDGVNDYVSVPNNSDNSFVGNFTFEGWINPASFALVGGQQRTILSKGSLDGNNVSFLVTLSPTGQLVFATRSNGGAVTIRTSTLAVPLNTFSHFAVTMNGNTLTFYINGVAAGTFTVPARPKTTGRLTFGAVELSTGIKGPFQGILDEISLYSTPLTTAQILAIYNAGSAGKCKPSKPRLFQANLTGGQMVPAVMTNGQGTGYVYLNAQMTSISVSLSFSGLVSRPTAAHLHGAAAGSNGPIVFDLGTVTAAQKGTTWAGSTQTMTFAVTPTQAAQLRSGQWYMDVHTQNRTAGEIRGQLAEIPLSDSRTDLTPESVPWLSGPVEFDYKAVHPIRPLQIGEEASIVLSKLEPVIEELKRHS